MNQLPLFPSERRTILSRDRKYRYALWRVWDYSEDPSYALFVGLNPSTADETIDDPTIRRCVAFAKAWGYGSLCMVNLFAWRATDPKDMLSAADPVGPENDAWLESLSISAGITIAAWGVNGSHLGRDKVVLPKLRVPHCLGLTKDGRPKHPLYLRADTRPFQLNSPLHE